MVERKVYGPVIAIIDYGIFDIYAWAFGCRCQYKENCNRFDFDYCGIDSELESGVACKFKIKFIYKGNKNVEALNIRTAEEIKVLKRNLESLKQDTSLEQAEKAAKMEKIEKNITNLQKKCKEQTDIWIKEQQEDEKRAKARFAAK